MRTQKMRENTRSSKAMTKMMMIWVWLQVDVQLLNSTRWVIQYPQGGIAASIAIFERTQVPTLAGRVRAAFGLSSLQTRMVHSSIIIKTTVQMTRATRLPTKAVCSICVSADSFLIKQLAVQVAVMTLLLSNPVQPCAASKMTKAMAISQASMLTTKIKQTAAFDIWLFVYMSAQPTLQTNIAFELEDSTCFIDAQFSFIINCIYGMGLLGKTLKGRSARPGGLPPKKNIKIRQIAKTQEEFDQLKKLAKMKKDILRSKIESEHKIVNFNKKKLLTYWRKIMRIAKTEELRNEIDIYSQNNQRELDSKEAFIQMLDKNLDQANNQYQIAIRNHLIHIDTLFEVQNSRIHGLMEEFKRDVNILEQEYITEREEMEQTHHDHLKELNDMIETVKEEDRRKAEETRTEEQAFREEIKNKNLEDLQHMKFTLEAKQTKHYTELEQMHQKYSSDTGKKTEEHSKNFEDNKNMTLKIDELARNIARKRSKIDLLKLKILQHKKESGARNNALKKEKDNISKNYQELKEKMNRFREEEDRRLKELTNNSRNAVEKLKDYLELGERILKTAELCRRLETEKEKVLPFYENTVDQSEISEEMKSQFQQLTPEEYQEFKYLNNFFKRHNKVLLDRLAIARQKDTLNKDNQMLKSLLKQYLDGISLNDEVLRTPNPLFIVNNRINITQQPVEEINAPTIIDANVVHSYNMSQLGRMAPQRFQ